MKLFFQLDRFRHPGPVWFIVTSENTPRAGQYSAKLADMKHGDWARRRFPGDVSFELEHIYRLPMDRPETENPLFDSDTRS